MLNMLPSMSVLGYNVLHQLKQHTTTPTICCLFYATIAGVSILKGILKSFISVMPLCQQYHL